MGNLGLCPLLAPGVGHVLRSGRAPGGMSSGRAWGRACPLLASGGEYVLRSGRAPGDMSGDGAEGWACALWADVRAWPVGGRFGGHVQCSGRGMGNLGLCPLLASGGGYVLRSGRAPGGMSSGRAGEWAIWDYVRCSRLGLGMCCARAGLQGACPVMVPRVGRVHCGLTFGLGLRAGDPGGMSSGRAGEWAIWDYVRCSRLGLGMCCARAGLRGTCPVLGPGVGHARSGWLLGGKHGGSRARH